MKAKLSTSVLFVAALALVASVLPANFMRAAASSATAAVMSRY
jgi:hypothetical protein